MTQRQSTLFINKLEAARRQIDAAIRMFLSNEDEIAIHTLAAAGYQILRDVKKSRGKSEFADGLRRSTYYFARDLLNGTLEALPDAVVASPGLIRLVEYAKELILCGKVERWEDLHLSVLLSEEASFWRAFNLPASFLKHADRDPAHLLDTSSMDNETLLQFASHAYGDIMRVYTPEMEALFSFFGILPGFSEDDTKSILTVSPSRRRRNCLALLRRIKSGREPRYFDSPIRDFD